MSSGAAPQRLQGQERRRPAHQVGVPVRPALGEHPPAFHCLARSGRQYDKAAGLPAGRVAAVKTYTVRAKRWERGWELHIDDVGVTQSHTLRDAEMMARDYIELDTGAAPGSFTVVITPEIGDGLDSLAREAREATTAADKAQREAAARSREIARRLREAGLNGRDIAKVLDVSPQRVSQLLKTGT